MEQISMFESLYETYKIKKPIKLIELFGGIGSQAKALKNLNVNFEHYRLVEFDKYPVGSYNEIHGTNFTTQDIKDVHAEDLGIRERERGIHNDILVPMPRFIISRKGKRDV